MDAGAPDGGLPEIVLVAIAGVRCIRRAVVANLSPNARPTKGRALLIEEEGDVRLHPEGAHSTH